MNFLLARAASYNIGMEVNHKIIKKLTVTTVINCFREKIWNPHYDDPSAKKVQVKSITKLQTSS